MEAREDLPPNAAGSPYSHPCASGASTPLPGFASGLRIAHSPDQNDVQVLAESRAQRVSKSSCIGVGLAIAFGAMLLCACSPHNGSQAGAGTKSAPHPAPGSPAPPPPLPATPGAPSPSVLGAPAPSSVSWADSVLYFVIVDRFADGDPTNNAKVEKAKGAFHGGDLKGLRQHLDEIAGLGVTALWITPVVKNIDGFVTGAGFPDWAYHGYWADDFTNLDARFGTEEDLEGLVNDCHARGIKVMLDVVYNHSGYGSRYLTDPKTKGWLRSEETRSCGGDDLTSCVAGLPDFRTELPEVAEYLYAAHLGLAKRTGLDGFRLDTVKHVDHPFWDEHRRRARSLLGANFFLLGEVWGGDAESLDPWFAPDEMDAGFDFSFQGSALGFVQGRGRTVAFDRYLKLRERVRAGHLLSHFLSSHDVPGALFQLGGDKTLFRLAATLELTSAGLPMIYYGEEVGRPGGDWPDNRSDMPWGDKAIAPGAGLPRDEMLRAFYKRLIAVRRAHPALSRGVHTALSTEGDLLVFVQREASSKDAVVVALNRGSAAASATFPVAEEWGPKTPRDLLGAAAFPGTKLTVAEGAVRIEMAPKSAMVIGIE